MSPMGIVAMIGFFGSAFVLTYFTFFDPYGVEKAKRQKKEQKKAGIHAESSKSVKNE